MGYIHNQEEGVGLPPIEEAVRDDYGPLCRKHGVGLYLEPRSFNLRFEHPSYGRGKQDPKETERLIQAFEADSGVKGILYSYGEVMKNP